MPGPADNTQQTAGRGALAAWCLYDWASQGFSTIIVTFVFATYFTEKVAIDAITGTEQWGDALGLSALCVAIAGPVMGAIADHTGRRKPWLFAGTAVCVVATAALWFAKPDASYAILTLFLVAVGNIGFEFASIFYNAMLPGLARRGMIGRLSGWGWGIGYVGGVALLVICLLVFIRPETPILGLDKTTYEPVRATAVLVAAWYVAFSIPLFVWTPDAPPTGLPLTHAARAGVRTLIETVKRAGSYRNIALFLIARMIYTDGLNTLFAFGGIYAASTFGMTIDEVLLFGLALTLTAGSGAVGFAWIDDWIGAKRTIIISIAAITVLGAILLFIETKTQFWIFAVPIGLFLGPAQSASRSMMGRLAPPQMRNEMFGLYAFSGKATAFLGPVIVGTVTAWTASQRYGMSTILVFLAIGLVLLLFVRDVRSHPAINGGNDAFR